MVSTVVDVRDIDGEPFGAIMTALADLEEAETLTLVADFEPVPLYGVIEERGFEHDTEVISEEEYRVEITPA